MAAPFLKHLGAFALLVFCFPSSESACSVPYTYTRGSPNPLIIERAALKRYHESLNVTIDLPEFLVPDENGEISFASRRWYELKCREETPREFTCNSAETDIACGAAARPSILSLNDTCGQGESHVYTIGWSFGEQKFIPQITICFVDSNRTTSFVKHAINGRALPSKMDDGRRPSFTTPRFLAQRSVNSYYQRSNQVEVLRGIAVLTSTRFLARGHLAPDADYTLLQTQDATYSYANVIPQWQSINNGNWKNMEGGIRDIATRKKVELIAYTGTYFGVLRIGGVEIYLKTDETKKQLPVPAVMWKVVIDEVNSAGLAIFMVNYDERLEYIEEHMASLPLGDLCPELSQGPNALVDWDINDHVRGRTYCTSVADFVGVMDYVLPNPRSFYQSFELLK